MEILVLLGLLGFGAATGMGGGSDETVEDDAATSGDDPDEITELPEAPQEVNVGTDGNDTVRITDQNFVENANLGDGDDRAYGFVTAGSIISGGEGNDTIDAATRSTLFGNAGNDSLLIGSFNGEDEGQTNFDSAIYGGDGNDYLFSDRGYVEEGTINLFGDAGNDNITVRNEGGSIDRGGITKILTGGEGDDSFSVQLIFSSADRDGDADLPEMPDETNVFITDFTPGTETLTVTAYGLGGTITPSLETAELVQDDEGLTTLHMTFVHLGDSASETTSIALGYAGGITASDINFEGFGMDNYEFVGSPRIVMGEVLTIPNDGGDINGTDGNDTLISEISGNEDLYRDIDIGDIRLGDGDDLADVALFAGNIYGELGNDTITTTGIDGYLSGGDGDDLLESNGLNIIEGGEGNDTLIGAEAEQMYGGAGDDVLSADIDATYDGSGRMDGGTGDDTLSVSTAIGYSRGDFPNIGVVGGEGADVVELQLNMSEGYEGYGDEIDLLNPTSQSTAIYLSDFDADEDSLVIHINRADGNEAREMTSAEIVTTEREFQGNIISTSNIVMTFAATDTFGEHITTIGLGNDVNLTIDDIVFVQN